MYFRRIVIWALNVKWKSRVKYVFQNLISVLRTNNIRKLPVVHVCRLFESLTGFRWADSFCKTHDLLCFNSRLAKYLFQVLGEDFSVERSVTEHQHSSLVVDNSAGQVEFLHQSWGVDEFWNVGVVLRSDTYTDNWVASVFHIFNRCEQIWLSWIVFNNSTGTLVNLDFSELERLIVGGGIYKLIEKKITNKVCTRILRIWQVLIRCLKFGAKNLCRLLIN